MWGPPMSGNPRGLQPADPNAPPLNSPPVVNNYVVSPGSIEGATSTILMQTQHSVDTYTSLKDYINSTKSWIFDMNNADVINQPQATGSNGGHFSHPHTDPHPEWTKQMTAVSDNLLLQVADAIELAGNYTDALNNAGQFYVKADKDSVLPTLRLTQHQSPA
jgi:hypothetical protein